MQKPENELICHDEPDGVSICVSTYEGSASILQWDFGRGRGQADDTVTIVEADDARAIAEWLIRWADWADGQ